MKKIISLVLVVTMVIAFLNPVFASQNYNDNMVGDTANNDIKCRMPDLFYSYPSLLLYSTGLQEHSANLAMIEANVTNEYVTTPAFYISSILYGTSIATNKKELTKYIFDKVGITNFAEEKYMDDANTKLLKALCAYNFEYGWFENAGDMVSSGKNITSELNILNQIFTFANKASEYALLQSGMSKEQLYKDYFSYALAKLKDECTYINPDDWTIINGQFYTYSSEISEALSGTTDIINFITGFASSILTYNYYIKITDEIMKYAPKNSDLYIGMKWQKNRLMAGFVTTYGIEKIKGEALGKIAGLGSDLIKEIGNKNLSEFNKTKSLFDLVSLSVNMVCNFILDNTGLTKPDDYFTELVLAQYSNDMYNYLSNKVEATYGHMFEASEIYKFDQMSGYYLTTADLVKNELSEIAKHNSTYNKKYIEDKYKNLSFQQMIEKGINFISSHDVSKFERENNNEEYTVISDELYLLEASDDIKENVIYTTNNVIKSSLRATGKKIIIPNGENIIIDGNLDINNSLLEINGSLTVTGNMIINGSNIEIPKGASLNVNGNYRESKYKDNYTDRLPNVNLKGTVIIGGYADLTGVISISEGGSWTTIGDTSIEPLNPLVGRFCPGEITINDGEYHSKGNLNLKTSSNWMVTMDIGSEIHLITQSSYLYVYKDYSVDGKCTIDGEGKTIFCGEEVQKIHGDLINFEIRNTKGLYADSLIFVEGICDTKGNPFIQADGCIDVMKDSKLYGETKYRDIRFEDCILDYHVEGDYVGIYNCEITSYGSVNANHLYARNSTNYGIINCVGMGVGEGFNNKNYLKTDQLNGKWTGWTGQTYYEYINNYGTVVVKDGGEYIKQRDDSAKIVCTGDEFNNSTSENIGTVLLQGSGKQTVSGSNFATLIIDNPYGVSFTDSIKVAKLFDHKRNPFELKSYYNIFVDYDGDGYNDDIDAYPTDRAQYLKHNLEYIDKQDETCTSNGHNPYYICKDCGRLFKDNKGTTETTLQEETISAIGHNWTLSKMVPPSFFGEGYTLYTCSICNEIRKTDYIDKLTLGVPELSVASNTTSGICLKWNEITGADGYIIYRKNNDGNLESIADIKSESEFSFVDNTALHGVTYFYTIRAYAEEYMSDYSEMIMVKAAGVGTLKDSTNSLENVGNAILVEDIESLKNKMLNSKELKALENGETVTVYLTISNITDNVDLNDLLYIENIFENSVIGMCLDIKIYSEIEEAEVRQITDTKYPVTIRFTLPDEFINYDNNVQREYKVVRIHNGISELMDVEFNKTDNTVSFSSDKFSTYVLIYRDNSINVPEDIDDNISKGERDLPETGDVSLMKYVVILVLSAGIVAKEILKRKSYWI